MAAVNYDPNEAVNPGAARLPQGPCPGRALVLVRHGHRAERDVEFAAPAVPGVQARRALLGEVGDVPAVAAQHPCGRRHQAGVIEGAHGLGTSRGIWTRTAAVPQTYE